MTISLPPAEIRAILALYPDRAVSRIGRIVHRDAQTVRAVECWQVQRTQGARQ